MVFYPLAQKGGSVAPDCYGRRGHRRQARSHGFSVADIVEALKGHVATDNQMAIVGSGCHSRCYQVVEAADRAEAVLTIDEQSGFIGDLSQRIGDTDNGRRVPCSAMASRKPSTRSS